MIGTQPCYQYICRCTIKTTAWWNLCIPSLLSTIWLLRFAIVNPIPPIRTELVTNVEPLLSSSHVQFIYWALETSKQRESQNRSKPQRVWILLEEVDSIICFLESIWRSCGPQRTCTVMQKSIYKCVGDMHLGLNFLPRKCICSGSLHNRILR